MDRARAVFAALFLVVPVLIILAAIFMAGLGADVALGLGAVGLLMVGFVLGIAFVEP